MRKIRIAADQFGIPLKAAIRMRIRYILNMISVWDGYWNFKHNQPPEINADDLFWELVKLKKWGLKKARPSEINDEMIQLANDYPIDKLFEFNRNQIKCPFHDDKNPSAFHGTKTNRLICPVCNKTWGAINILMERDGLNFVEAVKQLN